MDYPDDFDACLANMIDSIKQLLFSRHNDIFERLDFDNDSIYLEPLLYTYVNQKDSKWLDCIIYGYEKEKKQSIEVFSNDRGIIYVPQIGYFKTNHPSKTIILETKNNKIILKLEGEKIDYDFEPILFLFNGMELVKSQHPLLEEVFTCQIQRDSYIYIEDVYKTHVDSLNKGLAIIEACNPNHYKLLLKNLKKIMLFSAQKPNSFAVLKAHNMIFLNVNKWNTEMFFADHVSHEGAHITFFTFTYESKYQLFKCDPHTLFSEVTGNAWEHSTIYLRFHGLFTYYEITKGLEVYINNKSNPQRNLHEAKGRQAFHLKRFKLSIDPFEESIDIFSSEGIKWFEMFKEHYFRLEHEYGEILNDFNLNEQPYDFNSEIFEKQNSL